MKYELKLIVVIHLTVEKRAKRMPHPTVETTNGIPPPPHGMLIEYEW